MVMVVVRNLLTNAIKFTPHGGQIELFAQDQGNVWGIGVRDSGMGMNATTLENLLNPSGEFVSTPGTDQEMGNGIGLQLCKELLEQSGSLLQIDSKPGQGSCFWFDLPKPA